MMALLGRLFVVAAARRSYLLVVENADHLDQSSQALLQELGRALPGSRAGLLLTRRTDGSRTPDPISGERLSVGQLSRTQSALLAQDVWRQSGGGSPPPWLPTAVRSRADGNPLFIRTVTTFLHEHWEPGQPPPAEDFATGSLGGLLAERVDRLPAAAHQLLNVLAVARKPCTLPVAAGLVPERLDDKKAASTATMLVTEGLVHLDTSVTEVRYRLVHGVLQQVVYQAMSHAERGRLHRLLASQLSKAGADPIEVAEHVARLDDPRLARRWFPRAADSARASWNLLGAVAWWQLALPLLAGPARAAAEVELLELLLVVGRANEVLALAAEVMPDGVPRPVADKGSGPTVALSSRRMHAVAEAALVCGDLDRSESAAVETMRLTAQRDEPRHQRAAELLVLVRCARGDFRSATATAQEQLTRAVRSGDLRAVTTAQASLGAALLHAGLPEPAAPHYERALVGAVALGDVIQQIHVLSDLAGCAFETGRHADCVELLARARESADRIGYRRHLAFNLSNEAQLRAALGDKHAATCASAAVQRSLEMGDLTAAANALHTWVTSEVTVSADPNRWRRLRAIDTHLGRRSVAAADAADQALAAARCGRTDAALRVAAEATTVAQKTDQAPVLRRAALARLVAELRNTTPDTPTRVALLAELQSLAEGDGLSDVDAAELSLERWGVTGTDPDRDRAVDLARQAFDVEPSAAVRRWLSELGVPAPAPPTPLPPPVGIGRVRSTRKQLDDAFRRLEAAIDEWRPMDDVDDGADRDARRSR